MPEPESKFFVSVPLTPYSYFPAKVFVLVDEKSGTDAAFLDRTPIGITLQSLDHNTVKLILHSHTS